MTPLTAASEPRWGLSLRQQLLRSLHLRSSLKRPKAKAKSSRAFCATASGLRGGASRSCEHLGAQSHSSLILDDILPCAEALVRQPLPGYASDSASSTVCSTQRPAPMTCRSTPHIDPPHFYQLLNLTFHDKILTVSNPQQEHKSGPQQHKQQNPTSTTPQRFHDSKATNKIHLLNRRT